MKKRMKYDANPLLDELRRALGLKNDAALSRVLEVAPPIVSKIRHGKLPVGPTLLINMHEVSGMSISALRSFLTPIQSQEEPQQQTGYTVTPNDIRSITDTEVTFGTARLLPKWEDIPEDFKAGNLYTRLTRAINSGTKLPDARIRFNKGFEGIEDSLNRAVSAHLRCNASESHKLAGVALMIASVVTVESAITA